MLLIKQFHPTERIDAGNAPHRSRHFKYYMIASGLKPLVTYWFRVIAIGLNGQLAISDAVSRVIL